jgi:5'(3')-deoxyribonucleotidase
MRIKPRILLDCDGVLSDFVTHALDFVHRETGDYHDVSEITHWDVLKSLGKQHLLSSFNDEINTNKFCKTMPVFFDAKNAVKRLQHLGEVFIVTAPYNSPAWVVERASWIKTNFGIENDHIANLHCKYIVAGDVFIDDSTRNIDLWQKHHPNALSILWETPYSKKTKSNKVVVTNDWEYVIDLIKKLK